MHFKPDFESIIPRMEAFWRGEILDRACVAVTAPSGKPRREVPAPADASERRTNQDYILDAAEAGFEATYFGGDAIPTFRPDLGPDMFSALVGGELEYTDTSSWAKPILDWENPPSFEIDRGSFEWQWHLDTYRKAADRARGRYFVGAPDCHSGGDCLLAMRGGTNLCYDIYDRPEALHAAMRKLERAVVVFHEELWLTVEAADQRGHSCSWLETWSPERSNVIQLDLLAIISPDQFREFFYHELEAQCDALGQTIFHLDGPDAVKHLPALYDLFDTKRSFAAVQWVYGEGNGPMLKWLPLLKEMQSHGVGLWVQCDPGEVEAIMKELSSRGLYIRTYAGSREEADEIVKLVGKLTHA
jgi:hypothetical protein